MTLFSVNSFLYGFYLAPILSAQKMRIEDLHKTVRAEANAIFSMALTMKKLPKTTRSRLQGELAQYVLVSSNKGAVIHAEREYEDMITYCLEYKGKDTAIVEKILNSLIDNQKNRTQFMMQVSNKVYSNEWMIILMLFSITVGFVLMLDIKGSILLVFIKALLCTGLTMLLVIIVKLSTLTHKKAKEIWNPFRKLSETNFYRMD
ncbi:hypothetical protein KC867_01310 [Candidatus Saccharibacteria bacterium]|nr:hypothetical protein [Candidatus Saccharibacteria bacterium]